MAILRFKKLFKYVFDVILNRWCKTSKKDLVDLIEFLISKMMLFNEVSDVQKCKRQGCIISSIFFVLYSEGKICIFI